MDGLRIERVAARQLLGDEDVFEPVKICLLPAPTRSALRALPGI
jgi:hypothetical protein